MNGKINVGDEIFIKDNLLEELQNQGFTKDQIEPLVDETRGKTFKVINVEDDWVSIGADLHIPLICCELYVNYVHNKGKSTFEKLSRELMKYLAENHHPHTSILITSTTAELLEGKACIATDEYLKD